MCKDITSFKIVSKCLDCSHIILKCMSHDSQTYKECKNVKRKDYVFEGKRVTDFAFSLEKKPWDYRNGVYF